MTIASYKDEAYHIIKEKIIRLNYCLGKNLKKTICVYAGYR